MTGDTRLQPLYRQSGTPIFNPLYEETMKHGGQGTPLRLTICRRCREPDYPRKYPEPEKPPTLLRSIPHLGTLALLSLLGVSCATLPVVLPEAAESGPATADSAVVADQAIDPHTDEGEVLPVFQTRERQKVYGYYAWWTRALWLDLNLGLYDKLFFFDLTPASDGSILDRNGYPFAWQGLIAKADSAKVPVIPTLALLNADSLEALFLNPDHRSRLLDSSVGLIEESGGAGLHLDFEWFAPSSDSLREGFHAYVDTLASVVSEQYPDAELSMFVPAFHPDGMIDINRIPEQFGEIMVQGYDIHWQTGPNAGPLSPISGWKGTNWQSILDAMDEQAIDRERLFITVPYYGYEWPVESEVIGAMSRGAAQVTTYARLDTLNVPEMQLSSSERALEFGRRRDRMSGSPWYVFSDSTGWYQGWYEDDVSLDAKYRFVEREGLAGIAVFPIGYDDGLLSDVLVDRFGDRLAPPDSAR